MIGSIDTLTSFQHLQISLSQGFYTFILRILIKNIFLTVLLFCNVTWGFDEVRMLF